jgi:hypothetical protein
MNHLKILLNTKFTFQIIILFNLFTFIACSPSKQDSKKTEQVPVRSSSQEQTSPVNNKTVQPVQTESPVKAPAEKNNAEVMLNPPHGEPYHRCDIPVGAPLNSPPANTNRQTTNRSAPSASPQTSGTAPSLVNNPTAPTIENAMRLNSGQTQSTAQTNNNTVTKPRLNPAHGQPWHRCDIPVGSPLP